MNRQYEARSGDQGGHHTRGAFDDPLTFAPVFDAPERERWQKPDLVIQSLNLTDDAAVMEIGAGTGYFTVRLAEVLKNGHVIAIDKSEQMSSYLRTRASGLGLTNVDVRTIESDGSADVSAEVDLVFSVDVYHHLQDPVGFFSKVRRNLKPNGALVVIDRTDEIVEGQPSGHRVPAEQVISDMKLAGFLLTQQLDLLLPVQYFLSFRSER